MTKQVQKIEKKEQQVQASNLKALDIKTVTIKIKGTSPYLPSPLTDKVVDDIEKKKLNLVVEKDKRTEVEKAKTKFYYTTDGKVGIPARAFYCSMIAASKYLFEKSEGGMKNIREGVTFVGDILPLKYKKIEVVKHFGRNSGMTRAPTKIIRNAIYDWEVDVTFRFNAVHLSLDQIISVLRYAGFYIGVGSFRKEKTGNYGSFDVVQ